MTYAIWKQKLKSCFCCLLTLLMVTASLPVSVLAEEASPALPWPTPPEIQAAGAVVIEASTGSILYNRNAYEAYYPASTTKLMTALLAIEQCPLSDVVTCSRDSIYSIDWTSSRIGLDVGEQLTMEESLYAILLASANEVCYAVGEHVGGTMEHFVSLMNQRAEELGCVNTNFTNPHGLDDPQHYTCPYDLALIAKQAIQYTTFRRISGSYYHQIPATNLNVARPIGNTHQIIRRNIKYDGVFAGKTGHTTLAGNSLVTCAERDGLTLICVVMKESTSDNAYADTMALLDYAFDNFHLYELSSSSVETANAFPVLFEDEDAFISEFSSPLSISSTTLVLPLNASYADVTKEFSLTPLTHFSEGENIIGEVSYYYSDAYVGSSRILYYSPIEVSTELPPASAEDGSVEPNETPSEISVSVIPEADTVDSDLRPLIIGIIVGVLVLIIGCYIVLIELPYRKKKKAYKNRKRTY